MSKVDLHLERRIWGTEDLVPGTHGVTQHLQSGHNCLEGIQTIIDEATGKKYHFAFWYILDHIEMALSPCFNANESGNAFAYYMGEGGVGPPGVHVYGFNIESGGFLDSDKLFEADPPSALNSSGTFASTENGGVDILAKSSFSKTFSNWKFMFGDGEPEIVTQGAKLTAKKKSGGWYLALYKTSNWLSILHKHIFLYPKWVYDPTIVFILDLIRFENPSFDVENMDAASLAKAIHKVSPESVESYLATLKNNISNLEELKVSLEKALRNIKH